MRRLQPQLTPALVIAAWALAAVPLAATSYVMVKDAALVDTSPLIVEGTVAKRTFTGHAATEYAVAVARILKGEAGDTLVVRVPGGPAGNGLALKIWGAPQFLAGEKALLFLEPLADGAYHPMHLMLGAFHAVKAGGRSLWARDLAEVHEVGAATEPLRDAERFSTWVADRVGGNPRAADYAVAADAGTLRGMHDYFTTFTDGTDGKQIRWFTFDTGGNVQWKAYSTGQQGVSGGGYTQFQNGLAAWTNDPSTPIDYRYAGTTANKGGLCQGCNDGVNEISFNDPNGELPAFDCNSGGVLAYGGPWYSVSLQTFQGTQYHPIQEADVVINNGLSCFFLASPNGSKAAEEIFGHELGHTLGLGHSCGDSKSPACSSSAVLNDALMRADVHDDGRGARLNSDDQAGIASLYAQSNLPAAPTNLTAQTVDQTSIQLGWHDNATNETEYRIEERAIDQSAFTDIGSVPADSNSASVPNLQPASAYVFRVRANSAAGFSGYSNEAAVATLGPTGACVSNGQTACLVSGRFKVTLAWTFPNATSGAGQVAPGGTDNAALFYFDQPSDLQMLLKVLNGCGLNNHFWVFYAAATNVQLTITVLDTQTGAVHVYFNPQGSVAPPAQDTTALECP